jgi:hypothetical protein
MNSYLAFFNNNGELTKNKDYKNEFTPKWNQWDLNLGGRWGQLTLE